MFSKNKNSGFPISVIFKTKYRTLEKKEINSKTSFNDLIESFKRNTKYKMQAKLKNKYILNGKEIRNNQTLEEIIYQNKSDPSCSELYLELDDIQYSGDEYCSIYTKIIQPNQTQNQIGFFVYSIKEGTLNKKTLPEKTINLFELNKINEGSAYCNSKDDLFISGSGDKDIKDFWIINNKDFNIKKKIMPFSKQNHSMIYLHFNENEEWIFIAGGKDKKSFYYDLNKNYFINWGDTIDTYEKPALIRIGEYLYIFNNINGKKNYFERTKIINPTRKWEKVIPSIDKKIIPNFPCDFGVSYDTNGNILFLGGNNIINSNNTYVYNPIKNEITLSENGTNDNIIFSDKTFYKVNNRYNIAFPKNLEDSKEICLVDKLEQSLIKINIEIPSNNKQIKVRTKINFNDNKYLPNKSQENYITIKVSENQNKQITNINMNTFNQSQPQFICNNCANNKDLICNICHRNVKENNFGYNESNQKNVKKVYPYSEKIHDVYYPMNDKRYRSYGNYTKNDKVKVEIIYDEYTPIKVDYELGKPYEFKFNKTIKKEEKEVIKEEIHQDINNDNIDIKKEEENEKQDNKEVTDNINIIEENKEIEQQEIIKPQIKEEEKEENKLEEQKEEDKGQMEEVEEHDNFKQYRQKEMIEDTQHEKFKDSLEIEEDNKENKIEKEEKEIIEIKKEIIKEDELIKPYLKLDFGLDEHRYYDDKIEVDLNIIKGLKLNFDNVKTKKENKIIQNINIEESKEKPKEDNIINLQQENHNINQEEENQNIKINDKNIEEEVKYENNEDENENEMEDNGLPVEYIAQGENGQMEEVNYEEDGEEMQYEEVEENDNEDEQEHISENDEKNDIIETVNEDNDENQIEEGNEENDEQNN